MGIEKKGGKNSPNTREGLPVDIGSNFAEDRLFALKEIPRIGNVEEVNLHLWLDRRLAPHFVCLAPDFQDQLLLKKKKRKFIQ